jgi:hypothetical protein
MTKQRSALSLSVIEVAAAGIAALVMSSLHRSILWRSLPWGYYVDNGPNLAQVGMTVTTYERMWEVYGSRLFQQFDIPFALFAAISAVFAVRALRKDVPIFSTIGNLAMAWPLFGTALVIAFNSFSGCCWPVGLILVAVAVLVPAKAGEIGDLLAIPWNLMWLLLAAGYATQVWSIYGD